MRNTKVWERNPMARGDHNPLPNDSDIYYRGSSNRALTSEDWEHIKKKLPTGEWEHDLFPMEIDESLEGMVTDKLVEDRFGDLDFPGRKKPVNRTPEKEAELAERAHWDADPVYYLVGGVKREFFLISHLCKALGYSQQSVRLWEAKRLLPNTPYRSPRSYKVKQAEAAGHVAPSNKGKRLWTRAQIEGIITLAKKHKVLLNKKAPTPAFARDVANLYREILAGDSK